ncbi:MAG: peptide chain release factor N(5)-glutamine methyltransferase [Vicinamibacterales bacterium]
MSASLRDRLLEAKASLVRAGLAADDAGLDAEVLARHVLGWDRAQVFTRLHLPPPDAFAAPFAAAIARRVSREPVAYITGHREFWGLEFIVSPAVLIPRPETELIVERALALDDVARPVTIVDVGTGTGCIAVALAHDRPLARVVALDRSAAALAVAARNVATHDLGSRIHLVRANLLDAIAGPVDLIVANPPYVDRADAAGLQPEVTQFEPDRALFADDQGLAVLRRLLETAAARLAPGGHLIIEFGAGQDRALRAWAVRTEWDIEVAPDLAGIPRVAVLQPAGRR